jgi:PAS domain S-box-containing protein
MATFDPATDDAATDDAAAEARLRLSAIVETSEDAIIGNALDGVITSWNHAAERIFGYSETEAIGAPINLIVPPELIAEEESVFQRVRSGETIHHYETTRVRKGGQRIQVSLTASPIHTPSGEIIGASKIARDITQTKRLERDARHLAAIVESSDDAIISKDLDGTVVSWNRAAERLFGYSAAEIVGRSIRIIVPVDRSDEEDRVLATVGRGDVIDHFETIRRHKDGTLIPIALTVSPIRSEAGQVIGASKIARDMRRNQRAQRDAQRLAAIVDSSDDAIVGKDLGSIVTSWNRAAEAMFGYSAEDIIGKFIRLLIPDDRQQEEDEVLGRIRRGERVEHYETIRRRKDGTMLPVSLTVSPILAPDGTVIGASKIARDITDRQRADDERMRLLGIAREASQLKDEFLATLSHELRTPLNAIVGYLRMMQAGLLSDAKQLRAIDVVVRNATALTQIVEDVLDVSRIVSGKIRLDLQAVELQGLIEEVVDTVRPAADAKGITVNAIIDPRATAISGDPDRLRQILWNLCSNAVKFTERGGAIEVRLARSQSHVEVVVSDNGIGIAPEFLPHVFERFRQSDASIGRSRGGLGLGLAISRHLVEMQGGRIFVDSEGLGRGATFRAEFPIRTARVKEAPSERERPRTPAGHPSIAVPRLDGLRILVVDDDRDALALIREILEATGATVTTADSGVEALDKLKRNSADVLVADLGMPGMTGFDLIARIRQSKDPHIRELPAAALTAFARSEDRTRALRAGFQTHLSKPIEPAELMAATASLARDVRGRE